jgi:hypothetical protein
MTVTAFTVGAAYPARFVTDASLAPLWTVLSRSAKFITVQDPTGRTKRVGIRIWEGEETALPYGSYSMAPCIKASRPAAA